MKHIVLSLILVSLIIVLLQSPNSSDAKKIKIKLKDVKKLKKYAYLLAGQRKKFYAIPFPFPLPVFVKRQQIFTQVPIIPRYVTSPQQYSSSDSYEAESQRYPSRQQMSASSSAPSSSSSPLDRHYKRQVAPNSRLPMSAYYSSLASSSGYFDKLANALAQVQPSLGGVGGNHRDVFSKMLRGQAKVMSPVSLLTVLRTPTMPLNQEYQDTMRDLDYEQRPPTASKSAPSPSSSSSESSSASTSSSSTTSSDSSSSSSSSGSQANDEPKQSASELTRNQMRLRAMSPFAATAAYPFDPYRFASMQLSLPYASSFANAQMLAQMRLPNSLIPGADLLPAIGQQQQQHLFAEPAGDVGQSLEPQEVAASSPQDYETVEHHGRQPKTISMSTLEQQQYLLAMQRLRNQQQQQRSHQEGALRLALAREQEAMRLAESRAILIRAQHLGLPLPEQIRLARYYRPHGGM